MYPDRSQCRRASVRSHIRTLELARKQVERGSHDQAIDTDGDQVVTAAARTQRRPWSPDNLNERDDLGDEGQKHATDSNPSHPTASRMDGTLGILASNHD